MVTRDTESQHWLRLLKLHVEGFDWSGSRAICHRLQDDPHASEYQRWTEWMAILQDIRLLDVSRSSKMLQEMLDMQLVDRTEFDILSDHWSRFFAERDIHERLIGLLHELVYQMEIDLQGDYNTAFLIKMYRFRETLSVYLLTMTDSGKEYRQMLGRSMQFLPALFSEYHKGALEGFEGAYFFLRSKQLGDTIELRNRSLVGHGRVVVSDVELQRGYEGYPRYPEGIPAKRFLADMSILFRDLRHPLQENPYRVIAKGFCRALDRDIKPFVFLGKGGELITELIEEHLKAHQYKAILTIIEAHADYKKLGPLVHIARRLLWGGVSKKGLYTLLQRARRSPSLKGNNLKSLIDRWTNLEAGQQQAVIQLLFSQMKVFERRGDYDEWFIRAYRLTEELLAFYLGLDTKTTQGEKIEIIQRAKVQNSYFGQLKDTSTRQLMLHHLYPCAKVFQEVSGRPDILDGEWIDRLVEFHWHSYIGHGDRPLSPASIKQHWRSVNEVTIDFERVLGKMKLKSPGDWFHDVHSLIREQM